MSLSVIDVELNRHELGELLDLHPRHIQRLAAAGTIPKLKTGNYRLVEAVKAYVVYQRSQASELETQRARLAKAQADDREMKNAIQRNEVIPAKLFASGLAIVSASIVNILDSITIRLKRANPSLTQADLDIVRAEIVKARNECASIKLKN